MKIEILFFITLAALQRKVIAEKNITCIAQAMCVHPSKNDTKLTHVIAYPYPQCGKSNDLISIINESYYELIFDFMKDLTEQLIKKNCLLIANNDSEKDQHIKRDKCFSPVICNQEDRAQLRWVQIRPFPNCNGKSMKDLRNLFNESKQRAIKRIEELLQRNKSCPLKAKSTIDGLRKQKWTLEKKDAEDCLMPVHCQYETGVGENLLRFYPSGCETLISVPQAESAFTTVLNQAKKDFARDFNEECGVSCVPSVPTTSLPAFSAGTSIHTADKPTVSNKATTAVTTVTEITTGTLIKEIHEVTKKVTTTVSFDVTREVFSEPTTVDSSGDTTTSEELTTTATTNEVTTAVVTKVTNLTIKVDGTSFTPSWNPSPEATSYTIEVRNGSTSVLNVTNASSGTKIYDDVIMPRVTYNLSVFTVGDHMNLRSDRTTISFTTVLNNVTNLAVQVSGTSFIPSWSVSPGAKSYNIEVRYGSNSVLNVTNATSGTLVSKDIIKPGLSYNLSIVAINGHLVTAPTSISFTTEIDECTDTELTHNCHVNADCVNTLGSFNCSCRIGFTGNGTFCSDINECKVASHNCDTHADCTNTAGSFNCTCRDGFAGNGTICQDITRKDGWHKASDGHCYKLFKSMKNFYDARESCKNELNGSATLAIGVRNLTIRSEIVGALELASSLIPRVIWIGLEQQKSNGSWQWDDGTPMTGAQGLNGWRSGEPNTPTKA